MKQFLKRLIALTPYRVVRAREANRFQAIEETLRSLAGRGFSPDIIFDGGANIGDFSRLARRIFGLRAEIHMFEPQPLCIPLLEVLAKKPGYCLHASALGSNDRECLLLEVDPNAVTTGAHVVQERKGGHPVRVPVVTLDGLFKSTLSIDRRPLLKLDLQGWEYEALKGAVGTLSQIEVVLTEVSFFSQAYEPPISTLVRFFDDMGFDLHDIASLYGRPRDSRAHQADFVFVNRASPLSRDKAWS